MEKQLQDFLGVVVPAEVAGDGCEVVESLTNERVREILAEREPQLYVDKAVFVNSAGKSIVLATVPVTEKMCKGHFDWFPMMPLALLAQAAGQAGALLIMIVSDNSINKVPLAVHARDTKSISDKKRKTRKDFIVPRDTVLVVSNYIGGKFLFLILR